jgi:hypothetical protein
MSRDEIFEALVYMCFDLPRHDVVAVEAAMALIRSLELRVAELEKEQGK